MLKGNQNSTKKYHLTPVQKTLFAHHQFYPHDPSYNLTYCYKIEGRINLERFTEIWKMIYGSAGVFKVHFEQQEGLPFQVYDSTRAITLDVEHLSSSLTKEQWEENVIQYTNEVSQAVININEWPLSKFKVFYSNENISYFSMCFPHIIFDGYSGFEKFNLFSFYYNSKKDLDEIEIELKEEIEEEAYFTINHEEFLKHNHQALSYFKEELKDFEALQIEELEQKRDKHGRLIGQEMNFDFPADLSEKISTYIKTNNLSDFSFFLSTYFIMVHKLFSKNKIVTGIPLANRSRKNKKIFGYFVNSLPLGINIQEHDSFQDLCLAVKRKTMSLIRYQNFDISSHIKEILPEKPHKVSDKFNTLFTFYTQKLAFDITDCKVTHIPIRSEYLNFPLSSSVEKIEDIYRVKIQYGSYLKDAHLENIFTALIKIILSEDNKKISDIPLLEEKENNTLQSLFKANKHFPLPHTLHDMFIEQVLKSPKKVSIKNGEEQWTYQQLDELSNQIAHLINEKFPKQETNIAVSLPRSPSLVAVILGILKSGRAYVPVDPIMPVERLEYILSDLNFPPCIIDNDLLNKMQDKENFYCWKELEIEIVDMPKSCPDVVSDPEQLAYIIYTSGSTGKPKGVMVSHYNVLRSFKAVEKDFRFNEDDSWFLYHSYGFDPSIWEIFGSLLFGGKLVIVDELSRKAPDKMFELMVNEKITVLQMTPSAFSQLIEVVKNQEGRAPLSLRYIILGGETLHFNILKPWIEIYGDKQPQLFNVYGPTETTILATYYPIKHNDLENPNCSIIGYPLTDVELFVKNQYMENLPIGIPGELYIGGSGVSKGYYNREELTKTRFLEGISDQGNVYRTGDEVKMLPNGTLEFIERIDRQIQLRGYRVELGEIEFTLQQHSACKDSIVIVHTFKNNDTRLVAYVVLDNEHKLDESDLKLYLRTKLPEYMVPSLILEIPYKPMTVNGKIDYAALPAPLLKESSNSLEDMSIKEKIKTIWKEVLKVDNVNDYDNFFDIGGTSLLITAVYFKLNDKAKYKDFSMVDLFQYTTPLSLAAFLKQLEEPSPIKEKVPKLNNRKEALMRRKLINNK
ncbi:amino acid adenylation domain-containing protein [Peribacillus frigoritolerans]|uniref:non-ribosomal peptide synthetase n=1 Tax=Peribacillus frigoritolerans TaxID=450367 RepID=UPI002E1DD761|nr:amino acid adenylation domain-containing protein [Peribacillus frigoritolerans]